MGKGLHSKKPGGLNRLSVTWLILTVASIVCLQGILSAVLAGSGGNWGIRLDTVSGDPGVMRGVALSGTVIDYGNFVLDFKVADGVSSQKLDRRETTVRNLTMLNAVSDDWCHLTSGLTQYEMSFMGGAGGLRISRRTYDANFRGMAYSVIDMNTGYYGGTAEKSPEQKAAEEQASNGPTNQGSGTADTSTSLTINVNQFTPAMQELDGKLYFIIPKVRGCSGNSGLYVVNSFGNPVGASRCTKLADIPLDGGENEMILLAKAAGKLYLVRYNVRGLALQPYDPESRAFEAEIADNSVNGGLNGIYRIFSNGDCLTIVLSGEKTYELHTYDISNRMLKLGQLSVAMEESSCVSVEQIYFHGDRWYVLRKQNVWNDKQIRYANIYPPPDEVITLSVYDKEGREVYRGELDTCDQDDGIRYLKYNGRLVEAGAGINASYRRILNVALGESGS